jgi:hypothetical protein
VRLGRDTASSTTAEQAALSFQYSTDPNLLAPSVVSATPGTATGSTTTRVTTAASAALSGLTSGLTYYYRLVAVTDAGLETEAVLEGTISSFTTTGTTAQPLSFEAGADMVVGAAARPYPFAPTASGNPVVLASSDAAICTVAQHSVTPVAPGTCTLTASVGGNATYSPASVTDAFVVSAATAPSPTPSRRRPLPPTTRRPDADHSDADAGPDADNSTERDASHPPDHPTDRRAGHPADPGTRSHPAGRDSRGGLAGPGTRGHPAGADAWAARHLSRCPRRDLRSLSLSRR